MSTEIAAHLRSNVVGYVALFCFATLGTAQALPGKGSVDKNDIEKNAVRSKQIKQGQVRLADLGGNAVDSSKVADDSLTGEDVDESTLFNDNSLTGADIAEGTLAKVPDADQLDGMDSSAFLAAGEVRNSGRVPVDDPTPGGTAAASVSLVDTADIDVRFDCFQDFAASTNEVGRIEVLASDGKALSLSGVSTESTPASHNVVGISPYVVTFSEAVINLADPGNAVESGYFVAVHPDGAVVSGIGSAEVNDPASPPGTDCTFGGTITGP